MGQGDKAYIHRTRRSPRLGTADWNLLVHTMLAIPDYRLQPTGKTVFISKSALRIKRATLTTE